MPQAMLVRLNNDLVGHRMRQRREAFHGVRQRHGFCDIEQRRSCERVGQQRHAEDAPRPCPGSTGSLRDGQAKPKPAMMPQTAPVAVIHFQRRPSRAPESCRPSEARTPSRPWPDIRRLRCRRRCRDHGDDHEETARHVAAVNGRRGGVDHLVVDVVQQRVGIAAAAPAVNSAAAGPPPPRGPRSHTAVLRSPAWRARSRRSG